MSNNTSPVLSKQYPLLVRIEDFVLKHWTDEHVILAASGA